LEQANPDSASDFTNGHCPNHGRLPAREPIYVAVTQNARTGAYGKLAALADDVFPKLGALLGPKVRRRQVRGEESVALECTFGCLYLEE
jgi:hypothetical protein